MNKRRRPPAPLVEQNPRTASPRNPGRLNTPSTSWRPRPRSAPTGKLWLKGLARLGPAAMVGAEVAGPAMDAVSHDWHNPNLSTGEALEMVEMGSLIQGMKYFVPGANALSRFIDENGNGVRQVELGDGVWGTQAFQERWDPGAGGNVDSPAQGQGPRAGSGSTPPSGELNLGHIDDQRLDRLKMAIRDLAEKSDYAVVAKLFEGVDVESLVHWLDVSGVASGEAIPSGMEDRYRLIVDIVHHVEQTRNPVSTDQGAGSKDKKYLPEANGILEDFESRALIKLAEIRHDELFPGGAVQDVPDSLAKLFAGEVDLAAMDEPAMQSPAAALRSAAPKPTVTHAQPAPTPMVPQGAVPTSLGNITEDHIQAFLKFPRTGLQPTHIHIPPGHPLAGLTRDEYRVLASHLLAVAPFKRLRIPRHSLAEKDMIVTRDELEGPHQREPTRKRPESPSLPPFEEVEPVPSEFRVKGVVPLGTITQSHIDAFRALPREGGPRLKIKIPGGHPLALRTPEDYLVLASDLLDLPFKRVVVPGSLAEGDHVFSRKELEAVSGHR